MRIFASLFAKCEPQNCLQPTDRTTGFININASHLPYPHVSDSLYSGNKDMLIAGLLLWRTFMGLISYRRWFWSHLMISQFLQFY